MRDANFPDSRIGASLKPAAELHSSALRSELPRFANRGLIEAVETLFAAVYHAANFPDSRIGASLKPLHHCHDASLPFNFPDSRIGASLKASIEDHQARAGMNFPDSRIGASLKEFQGFIPEKGWSTSPIRESGPH